MKDIFADPHYAARGNLVKVADADFGTVTMPGVVPRFSRSETGLAWSGGPLGQHNEEVYAELGLTPAELDALRAAKVI